jgi:predicted  nucleic acid-binding Zn-ribbon protein
MVFHRNVCFSYSYDDIGKIMAIRIRKVIKNYKEELVALCAAETDPKIDDLYYLDDNVHHALSKKFEADFKKMGFWKSKDEISKWRKKYETAIRQKRALEDRVAELSKSAIR